MCPDHPCTDLLLNSFRKFSNKCQATRYPRYAAIETQGEIVQAQIETAMQFHQQPPLFQGGFPFGRTQRTIQYQRFGFGHVPYRGDHGIPSETFQRPDPFVAVDDDEAIGFFRQCDNDDRYLLSSFGKRRQQSPFAYRTAHVKIFIAQIKLVKFQFHSYSLTVSFDRKIIAVSGTGISQHMAKCRCILCRIYKLSAELGFRGEKG